MSTEVIDNQNTNTVSTETQTTTSTDRKRTDAATIIAIVSLLAFVVALIFIGILYIKNKRLREQVTVEKTRSETIVREQSKLKQEVTHLNTENTQLDQSLEKAFSGMKAKDVVIEQLNKENATLLEIQKEIATLESVTTNLKTTHENITKIQDKVKKIIEAKQTHNQQLKSKIK